jgi:regulator of RNase E activity RraA
VRAHNIDVTIDGVCVRPGDLVVADSDGVVIVPTELIDDVVRLVLQKDEHESEFRTAVQRGMKATDAFERFGVL